MKRSTLASAPAPIAVSIGGCGIVVGMDWALVISAASAAGLGTVVGSLVSQGRDRREARAKVLAAVETVERHRWAPDTEELGNAARGLETAALVARVPRPLVTEYVTSATAASWASNQDWDRMGGIEEAGGINARLAEHVRAAGNAVVLAAWHPWRTRLTLRWRVKKLRESAAGQKPEVQEKLRRARELRP